MAPEHLIPVPDHFAAQANIKRADYERMYAESVQEPEAFWTRIAEERLTWFQKWDMVLENDFANAKVRWFSGGKLNASYNCLDRHLDSIGDKTAIIWEGDNPEESRRLTYQQLHTEVSRLANVLKQQGVQKGDRVIIYLPMIPELAVSLLACARIGAIHSVVFGGFSPESLVDRIDDCKPALIITSDGGYRAGRLIDMKANVDAALERAQTKVGTVLVVKRTGAGGHGWTEGRDRWLPELLDAASDVCEPEVMDSEDPLFILYTSGSTGKPKGVLHTTAGYLLGASFTHHCVFDHKPDDIYWCTADIGWVTGHSYIVYGPLTNGATTLMFEGVPTYPDAGRFWDVVDKYQVNVFYTAPTAIRALSREGLEPVERHSLASLRLLGTVGEPINPEAWLFAQEGATYAVESVEVQGDGHGLRAAAENGAIVTAAALDLAAANDTQVLLRVNLRGEGYESRTQVECEIRLRSQNVPPSYFAPRPKPVQPTPTKAPSVAAKPADAAAELVGEPSPTVPSWVIEASPTPTLTPSPTASVTPSPTATVTATVTATPSVVPATVTPTPLLPTPTATPLPPTATPTSTPTPTLTPSPTATRTPTPTPTAKPHP